LKKGIRTQSQIQTPSNIPTQNHGVFKHVAYKEGCRFVGTPRYASLNTHQGIRQSRRDDLESIAYIMIYFYTGDLPWQGVKAKTKSEKKEKIKQLKYELDIENDRMFDNVPQELKTFLTTCRRLSFDIMPDYKYLRGLLLSLKNKWGFPDSPAIFQWEKLFIEEKTPYNVIKKRYKTLFEGYPTIPVSNYIDLIEKKKQDSNKNKNLINDNSDLSGLETQTQTTSELNKSKSSIILNQQTIQLPIFNSGKKKQQEDSLIKREREKDKEKSKSMQNQESKVFQITDNPLPVKESRNIIRIDFNNYDIKKPMENDCITFNPNPLKESNETKAFKEEYKIENIKTIDSKHNELGLNKSENKSSSLIKIQLSKN